MSAASTVTQKRVLEGEENGNGNGNGSGQQKKQQPRKHQQPHDGDGDGDGDGGDGDGELERLLKEQDPVQVSLMSESIIVVDRDDNVIRPGSKKECHLNTNIAKGLLHRAFSVFLFNSENKLLLQKRASEKITFPDYWANTCCSHPLHTPEEMEKKNMLGVKRAAIRKLEHELGIPAEQVPIEKFHYLTSMHYEAQQEGLWGEHEIDHVLAIKLPSVTVDPSPNEVQETRYFDEEELNEFIDNAKENGDLVAPWFAKLAKTFLKDWWKIVREDNLESITKDEMDKIHRL